jgi:iron complex transport system substrate-binding protein
VRTTRRRAGGLSTARALALALTATLLAGCASGAETGETGGSAAGGARCDGPATATAAAGIEPVAPQQPQLPATVTDITGARVTVTDNSRILALDSYGTLASTVYALGLGDRLVGRDVSTGIPDLMHLPLVTHNGHELNGEAILALRPTVVLTDYSIGPLEVQLQLKDSGIPVAIMSDQRSRALIGPQIQAVADALGVPEAGQRLAARVEADTRAAEAHVASLISDDPDKRLRMVFLYLRGNAGIYYWFGKGSGADDLIAALGGVDVASEAGLEGMRPLNAEGLVRADPDLFLLMSHGLQSVGGVDGLLKVTGVAETSAGVNKCVIDMSDYQILSFGPQFPKTLDALADAIYRAAP